MARPACGTLARRSLDGKMGRLRFKRAEEAASGFRAEWRAANRSFPVPSACSLPKAVGRVTEYFSEPHQTLTLTTDAEEWHLSYQGAMNVQAGARYGAAPWQAGGRACCPAVSLRDFCGHLKSAQVLAERKLRVTPEHLQRAYALLQLAPRATHYCVEPGP